MLSVASAIYVFAELKGDCGPVIAAVVAGLLWFLGEVISKLALVFAVTGPVGWVFSIASVFIAGFVMSFISNGIVDMSSQLCTMTTRKNKSDMNLIKELIV